MNINETYLKFLNKVNKNFINDNISVDKGRFVIHFTESQNKYTEWIFSQNNSSLIRNIQILKVRNLELAKGSTFEDFQDFKLPKNFFKPISVRGKISKGSCTDWALLFEFKGEDIDELYNDEDNKPSFEYRETFYTYGNNNLSVYKTDFEISDALLTYYRYPKPVDIEGYVKIDGTHSSNIDCEFNDDIVDKILDICVKDFNVNSENLERYQVDSNQIISNI